LVSKLQSKNVGDTFLRHSVYTVQLCNAVRLGAPLNTKDGVFVNSPSEAKNCGLGLKKLRPWPQKKSLAINVLCAMITTHCVPKNVPLSFCPYLR